VYLSYITNDIINLINKINLTWLILDVKQIRICFYALAVLFQLHFIFIEL